VPAEAEVYGQPGRVIPAGSSRSFEPQRLCPLCRSVQVESAGGSAVKAGVEG